MKQDSTRQPFSGHIDKFVQSVTAPMRMLDVAALQRRTVLPTFILLPQTTPPTPAIDPFDKRTITIDTFNKRTLGIYCFNIYLTFIFFKSTDTISQGNIVQNYDYMEHIKIRYLFFYYNKKGWVSWNYVQLATLHCNKHYRGRKKIKNRPQKRLLFVLEGAWRIFKRRRNLPK